MQSRIAVFGAGSWGSALAIVLARRGHDVRMWGRDGAQIQRMRADRCNERYLPGHAFPDPLQVSDVPEDALAAADLVLLAPPSHAFDEVARQVAEAARGLVPVIWATKGFEPGSGRLLEAVARDRFAPGTPTAVLSGPTFAGEIAAGMPAAVTIASRDGDFRDALTALFHHERFRVYTSDDMAGVQIGGAVKNVLAVAAGIADGLGFGANTRAALITRGLAELMRLGAAMGGRRETFMGLAGLGDLVLTCTDDQSRNRRFGLALAAGEGVAEAERHVGQVVEGRLAAAVALRLAAQHGVEMPIAAAVDQIVNQGLAPREAVRALLARDPGPEREG